jgi:hypothetical protein
MYDNKKSSPFHLAWLVGCLVLFIWGFVTVCKIIWEHFFPSGRSGCEGREGCDEFIIITESERDSILSARDK